MIKLIGNLPAPARREIEEYVALVRARYASHRPSEEKFENEGFFGISRDRDEMTDSTACF
ncbi:MAG: hypothetical protein AB7F88_09545 [Pyrinomonadaceae bacterium]